MHHSPRFARPSVATNPSSNGSKDEYRQPVNNNYNERSAGEIERLDLVSVKSETSTSPHAANGKHNGNEPTTSSTRARIGNDLDGLQIEEPELYSSEQEAMRQQLQKEAAVHASQASSGEFFEKDTPLILKCQKTVHNTIGIEWWSRSLSVKSSALCAECRNINFKAAFHPPLLPNKFSQDVQVYGRDTPAYYSLPLISVKMEKPLSQAYERDTAAYNQMVKDSSGVDWPVNDPNCQFCRYLFAARRRRSGTLDAQAGKYYIVFHNAPETPESESFRVEQGFPRSLFKVYITVCYRPWDGIHPFGPDSYGFLNTIVCHIGKPVKMARIPQIVSPVFNGSLACAWFDACIKSHAECKFAMKSHFHMQRPETRMIDCLTRELISWKLVSPGDDSVQKRGFVALSYVWGPRPTVDETTQAEGFNLPSQLPLTIRDAITVTLNLGFQYLWVDQYCINQSDQKDKSTQISQMDLIYNCADLTIIAASGADCNYGLPGVSERPRDVPDPFILDEVLTFGILPERIDHWERGPGSWHTRGWTFQEAHLSRRRLVFSDTAMHFECMRYDEWQKETFGGVECDPVASCSGSSKAYYSAWGKFKPVVGKSTLSKRVEGYERPSQPALQMSVEASILSYAEMVAQYTMRELTYPSDGLNAFRGAANALTEFNPPVYNVAGIPFVVYGDDEDSLTEATFSYGLSWRSLALSGNKLEACSDVPSSEFPSWSWGDVRKWRVSWTSHDDDLNHRLAASAIGYPRSVHIEFNAHGHKDLVHLADFAEAYRASPQRSQRDPTALCFKARLLPLRSKVHHTPSGIPSGLYDKPRTANEASYGFLGTTVAIVDIIA